MRIIDRLMRRRKKQTPRVIKVEPGMLTIEARGCRIVINENSLDKRAREATIVSINTDPLRTDPPYQLITNPATPFKSRTRAAIHVVKLKAPRKLKRAKPPEQESAIEGPEGAGAPGENEHVRH